MNWIIFPVVFREEWVPALGHPLAVGGAWSLVIPCSPSWPQLPQSGRTVGWRVDGGPWGKRDASCSCPCLVRQSCYYWSNRRQNYFLEGPSWAFYVLTQGIQKAHCVISFFHSKHTRALFFFFAPKWDCKGKRTGVLHISDILFQVEVWTSFSQSPNSPSSTALHSFLNVNTLKCDLSLQLH